MNPMDPAVFAVGFDAFGKDTWWQNCPTNHVIGWMNLIHRLPSVLFTLDEAIFLRFLLDVNTFRRLVIQAVS